MTKNNLKTMLIAVGLAASLALPVQAAEMANGEQIQAMLSGNTLQGSTGKDAYAEYYDPDGTLRGNGYSGKWKVEGNTGCMDYGGGFSCWTGLIDGNANIWYKDGKVDAAGMMIPGNPNKF